MNLLDPLGWAVILLLAGCACLILEVFIPSGGVLGMLAAVSLIAALVVAFQRSLTSGLSFTAVTLALVPLVIALAFHYWPRTPMGRAFLGEIPSAEEVKPEDPRRSLVGRVGVATSKMLPSGAVRIDGALLDAVSQGMASEAGEPVVVVEVRANRVMVRRAKLEEARAAEIRPADLLSRPIEEFGLESLDPPANG